MKITTQDYNNITVISLQGEIDTDSVEHLRNTVTDLLNAGRNENTPYNGEGGFVHKKGIVFDLSNVSFIDSQGLEFLLWARDYCNENNCQLRLASPDETCSKILEITRLENEFTCYSELSEAVKSFA